MSIMQKAIEHDKNISMEKGLTRQTWKEFREQADGRKVFLFGAGAGADFFFQNYKDIKLEGIIDNNVDKQGFQAADFLGEAMESQYGEIKISSVDVLKQYFYDEVVILITSINHYETIIMQLKEIGNYRCFVLSMMEADKRGGVNTRWQMSDHSQGPMDHAARYSEKLIDDSKIVFYSFGTYSDHGKYITEALLNIRKDLDIVWFVKNMASKVPDGVRKVYLGNKKRYIYEMETAKMWIYNMPVPQYIIKRSGQIYIQTKHWSSITLKKFYLDTKMAVETPEAVFYWKQDSRKIDYIITGSDFDTLSSRRGFDFHKKVVQIGSPRSDAMFLEKEKKEKVYHHYGLNLEKRMLLYAPTYRYARNCLGQKKPKQETREVDLDYEGVKEALEKKFGGTWYIALRLHPGHEKEVKKLRLPEYVVDLSAYEDGEETAAACDIMISDYSSIMFEPAFVKKPVFLFATDKKEYIDKEYDLLLDYEALPFPAAESNEELIKNIECFVQADYEKNLDDFMYKYGVSEDGHASERAAEFISGLVNREKDGNY